MDDELAIRLFGPLAVTRPDGTRVEPHEWPTGKTMDLFRLLALAGGRPVRVEILTDRLWPDSPHSKACGSLRTAASHVRRITRANCLQRTPDGIALVGARVDVLEFLRLAQQVHACHARGQCRSGVEAARQAEALHVEEFRAHDDASEWAMLERETIAAARLAMLCQASHCASTLGMPEDALDRARTAVQLDPSSENAHRLLMRAYAHVGEYGNALRTFERLRRHLAQELGIDPSPATREVHMRLLQGTERPDPVCRRVSSS